MLVGSTWLHAPSLITPSSRLNNNNFPMTTSVRIAVVGDVHDDWNLEEDTKALQFLQPDLVLFTGRCSCPCCSSTKCDFGNENVELVRSIANVKFPKAVILGNHDAWNTRQFSESRKDAVQLQLECLGDEHVGYRRLDFPMSKLSIVGGRPFSCGGEHLFRKGLLNARYGVRDMDGSAKKIYEAALTTPEDHSIIFLAHNGPTGLGSNINDICGRDWFIGGGDHGDPDLANAVSHLKQTNKFSVPLVVFGHMHKELAYGNGVRKMIAVGDDNTTYLNGAIVPRVRRLNNVKGNYSSSSSSSSSMYNETTRLATCESEGTTRAFTVADILDGRLKKIAEAWVSVIGDKTTLEEENVLFRSEPRRYDHSL